MSHHKFISLEYPGTTEYCPVSTFLKNLHTKCREGKKDDNLVIKQGIADVRSELEKLNWTEITDFSYHHLLTAEQSLPDVSFRYAIVYKDKRPVLFAYFQIFTLTSRNFNLHKDKNFVRNVMSLLLDLKRARALVLGNALRTESPGYCYDHTVFTNEEAIDALTAVAEKIAGSDDVSAIILPGISNQAAGSKKTLQEMGYSMPWEDNVMAMVVNPEWNTINDYVAALTRKYKARANKVLASGQHLTSLPLNDSNIEQYRGDINRLFSEVLDNQAFVFTTSGADYVLALKNLYKDAFEVTLLLDGEKPVAFYSAFTHGDAYDLFYVGFDPTRNTEYQLYFKLLMAGLERAILLKKSRLLLGRTSFDAKASLGATPQKTNYVTKLRRVPDRAIKWLTSYFSALEDAKWKLRNPLKA
jgi:hypothetical protein